MPGRLAGFAMLARRLDSFAQTREIIVIGMARRFVEVLDELMHARLLISRLSLSMALLVQMRLQCSIGNRV